MLQKFYLTILLSFTFGFAWSQAENCSGATLIANNTCVSGTAGTSQNLMGCVGNADDDVWYRFVATGTSHSITAIGSSGFDAVLQVYSGICSSLTSLGCIDNTYMGQAESTVVSGLTVGNTYYIRVYHWYSGSGSSTFTLCLNNPPSVPSNDACASPINLTVNSSCVNTVGTSLGATQSIAGCSGTANDDVWYSFTATNYTQTIQVAGSATFDAVIELYDGTCAGLTSLNCTDNNFTGGTEVMTASGLTPGVTYLFRVYDYYSTAGSTFSVCVSGTSIIAGSQPNDEPCNAIQLPAVTAECNSLTFSNVGATPTSNPGTPPSVCENYDNTSNSYGTPSAGGFNTSTTRDVWFSITVPASGKVFITPTPNQGAGWIQDGVMALYTGACGALTTYTCSDDYNYPAGYNDLQPFIRATGLTPGSTVYLRYWGYGSTQGNFGFCVQSPTNDDCANALYICDINGYSATTSPAYTRDHPCNMRGNGEGPGPTYSYSVNANPAGPFGAGGTWGTGSASNDVYIDYNSWVRFTAASPTISLKVTVSNCWGVGTNSITGTPGTPRGVQMQIFSTTSACCGFTPVSDFKENTSGSFVGGVSTYTVTGNSLTVGNDYYVMVDGWSGDICNYNIQAISGVSLPDITSVPGNVCEGQTSILTAPAGATGYTWAPTGQNTQTIAVIPDKTMTYTCYVGGVCGNKQTLTKTVTLLPTPTVSINGGSPITTCGVRTITLTASGANTYSWTTGNTTASFTTAPSSSTGYTVRATAANGCTASAVSNVTVNTVPTIVPSGINTICSGNSTSLTVNGANTYTWSPAISLSASTGTAVTATPTTGTNYVITATAVNGCTNTASYSVTVNSLPTVSASATGSVLCNGQSTTLSGTGATTYTWTGGISNGVSFTPTNTATYTVTGTNATTGCTNTAVRTITVTALPSVNANVTNPVICNGQSTTLSGSGATTYTWTGGITNGVAFSPTNTTSYTVTGTSSGCTNTAVATVTVNALPTVSTTATGSVICNGQTTTLNGTGANTYTWTGGITNGVAFSPTSTSNYTVTGTNATTGCTNTAVRTITVNPIPTSTASTSGTITCLTNTINLNSNLSGQSYTWTAPGGSSIAGGTANNQNAIGQGTGTYTLNVLSAAGCSYSTTLATNINTTVPTASATNGTLTCAQTSTVLVGGPTSGVTYNWSGPGILGSNTTANITVTVTGNYSLVTTSNLTGCSSTVSAVGIVSNNLTTPTVSAGSGQTITCVAPTVTLTGSATSGSTLNWSNGSTTNTTSVGGSGTYTLTATSPVTGCSATSTVQVAPSAGTPNGVLGVVSNSITCTNTTVAVSITSTSTPISILWSGPGISGANNTASTTVSQGGTYTVTLTNTSSGCSAPYTVVVPTNTAPVNAVASVAASSSITCNTTSLTLSSAPTGTNYVYVWSGSGIVSGGNTSTPVVNAGGIYTVTITNTINGCSGVTGTTNVAVPSNTTAPSINVSAPSVTTTCSSPTTIVTASSNSNPSTTYTWTPPTTGSVSNSSISNPVLGGVGVFTVALTNTVNGCASAQATVNVTADANVPTYTLSSSNATINCTTPNPTVVITTTIGGLTYNWSPATASGGNTSTPSFTAAGNYTATITNPSNGCSVILPVVAVSLDQTLPTANATVASSITCATTSLAISSTVTPTNDVTYNWSGPNVISGANTLNPIIGSGGGYVIAMTNTVNGCTGSYTLNVSTNTTVPTLSLSTNDYTTTCSAPSVVIAGTSNADPSTTYSWTAPTSGTISSTTVSNPTVGGNGTFTVTATNSVNGCVSAEAYVNITQDANTPTFTLSANAATVSCTMPTPSVTLTSTITGLTYSWSPMPALGGNTATPTFTASGTYTCLITNPSNNCSNSLPVVSVIVNTVSPALTVTSSSSLTCADATVPLTSVANPTNSLYSWSGPGIVGATNNSSVTANANGDYTLTATDPINGCSTTSVSSVTTNTTQPSLSVATTGTVINCSVSSNTLNAQSASGTPSWTTPSGIQNNPLVVTTSGSYTATIIDPVNGCRADSIINIINNSVIPNVTAEATDTIPCSSNTVTLLASSTTTDAVTYSWAGPTSGSIISGQNTNAPTIASTGVYTLTVTNMVNGCSATATVDVSQASVTASITADPMIGEAPLTVNFTNYSTGANSYNWNFGNGQNSSSQHPSTVFNTEGTYTVVMIASSSQCSDTASVVIIVEDGFTIEIPNVFTPNGDGRNDVFHIRTTGVASAEGSIYNRWGQLLYSWDALNTSWDGIASNGETCPDATYFYIIKVKDKKGKEHQAPGYVLIAR